MVFIRDLEGEEYFLQGVINHEQELNGDERIDIDIEYTDMNSEFLDKQDDLKMWIILFEGKEYRIISSKQTGFGDKYQISVTAVLYILDWLNTSRIYQRIDESLTVTEAFNIVFNDTPFTYSTVESAPSNSFEGIGEGETRLEIFKTFIDRYGYEFKIVGNVVYLYNQIGNDANFEYRYKVNAQNIEKEVDASEMWTYARGYGNYSDDDSDTDVVEKAKLKREYTSPLAKIIGIREAPPIRDGRVTQQATMDANLKKIVDESVQISFTADIYDMSQQGYDYQHAVLGDRVFLVDERIGLDTEIRVVKITRNFSSTGQILDLEITFGSGNMGDQYGSNLSTAAKDIADLIQGRKSLPFQALDIISKSMVTKIQNTTSEIIYDTNGQHFMDKKNNNNIMTMNSSGLLLSTDGGKTAKTAITAEGIVANTITTGALLTQNVNVIGKDALMYMNGDQFVAYDKNSLSRTTIKPSGITIIRPDGAEYIVNGYLKMDLEIQKNPLRYHTVEFDGRVNLTKESSHQYFEYFYTSHKARYLSISYAASWDAENSTESGEVELLIQEFGNKTGENRTVKQLISVSKSANETHGNIQIDLGVPTYEPLQCYLKFRRVGGSSTDKACIRSTRIYMRG
ncbi:phage tail protein [Staphylococcus arlettae]|uniref:phage tail protein n=1 Tax=Staphylococcus arlettae TaxID=29378 RepID=UPI0021B48C5A|nr:phage tail protein [Staphylococcus arlettae]